MSDRYENGLYRVHEFPPFVTDDMEKVEEAREDGTKVTEVEVTFR